MTYFYNTLVSLSTTQVLIRLTVVGARNCRFGDPSKPKPTLRAHVDERHSADPSPPAFKMEVTGVYAGDATKRQVSEAVKIRNTAGQMNRQEEWRQIRLPRLGLS